MLSETTPTMLRPEVPLYLTDGGLETTLVFHDGYELPEFAAFPLLETAAGQIRLRTYYERYIAIARERGAGFVLETPTWRASRKWARLLGYSDTDVFRMNTLAVKLMQGLRAEHETGAMPMLISGNIGPQDDGYDPQHRMSVQEAEAYWRGATGEDVRPRIT